MRAIALGLIPVLVAGFGSVSHAQEKFTLPGVPGDYFGPIIAQMAGLGFGIGFADPASGVITTEQYRLLSNEKLLDKKAGHWVDCGKELFVSRAATADYIDFRYTVTFKAVGDSTEITFGGHFSGEEEGAIEGDATKCKSRGRLEVIIIENVTGQ